MTALRPLLLLPLLAACVATPDPSVSVRHFASTIPYGRDARLHVFVFDPSEERSLRDRIRIARAAVAREKNCAWVDAPDEFIAEQTARQGKAYEAKLLAAPLKCRDA